MALLKSTTYRQIQRKSTMLGLELFDLLILVIVATLLLRFVKSLIFNVLVIGVLYVFLWKIKKGKPPKYLESLIEFHIGKLIFSRRFGIAGRDKLKGYPHKVKVSYANATDTEKVKVRV